MLIFFSQSHSSETGLLKVLLMKTKNLTTDHQISCQEFENQKKKLKHSDLTQRV